MNKTPLLLTAICFLIYRLTSYLTGDIWLPLLIFLIPISFLVLNLVLRKKLIYRNWFLSPKNILLERKTQTFQSDIQADLLYRKLMEVIKETDFTLMDTDENSLRILLGTSPNFWTWGENIYIHIRETQDGCKIEFTSVTIYGNTSWNRNHQNFDAFVNSFESSLTI